MLKKKSAAAGGGESGAPGWTRTSYLQFRKLSLCPDELRGRPGRGHFIGYAEELGESKGGDRCCSCGQAGRLSLPVTADVFVRPGAPIGDQAFADRVVQHVVKCLRELSLIAYLMLEEVGLPALYRDEMPAVLRNPRRYRTRRRLSIDLRG